MKKRIIVLYSFLAAFLIFFPTLIYIVGNMVFDKNFVFAHTLHSTLERLFGENNQLLFKKGDFYYKMGMYHEALENYQSVECNNPESCQKLYHNIGNTYFRLGESKETNQKIPFLQRSLESYKKSLSQSFHPETKKNHDYVERLLEDLSKQEQPPEEMPEENEDNSTQADTNNQQQKSQPEDKSDSSSTENADSNENASSTGSEKTQPQEKEKSSEEKQKDDSLDSAGDPNQNPTGSGSGKQNNQEKSLSGAGNDIMPKGPTIEISGEDLELFEQSLTPEERKQIEDYIGQLKDEEKQNMYLNKPKSDRNIFDILTEDFSDISDINQDW